MNVRYFFVLIAASGGSHQDVANRLGMAVGSVATRLSGLRKRGVKNVPSFTRGGGSGKKLNVDTLSDIFAETANSAE